MSGRVIVVGSINVDLVVRGVALPAPGETTTGGVFERHHGGKGANQSVAAARLGRSTMFIGAVGDDRFGEEARAALVDAGVGVGGLTTLPGEATGVALILVDADGENLIGVASGANARLSASMVSEALGSLGTLDGDVVLVSREIPPDAAREALRGGGDAGARTVLNPAPAGGVEMADLGLVDVLTPNRGELATITGGGVRDDDPEMLARSLLGGGLVREAVVVTLGSDGAILVPADGTAVRFAAHPLAATDSTGAGDAFSGALAAMLAAGLDLGSAVRRAVVAAGLSTTVAGAREGMPTSAEVEAAIAERP